MELHKTVATFEMDIYLESSPYSWMENLPIEEKEFLKNLK